MNTFRQGERQGHLLQSGREMWRELWRELREKFAKTKYTQALEAEVVRLRAENRAMLNSILGIAGVPPIPAQASEVEAVREAAGSGSDAPRGGQSSRQATAGPRLRNVNAETATPVRRRSWHQINRMLEFQATHQEIPTPTNGADGAKKP